MEEFVKMLADMKVRDLAEFERLVDVLPYAQIVEVNISLRAMVRAAKAKQNSIGMPSESAS